MPDMWTDDEGFNFVNDEDWDLKYPDPDEEDDKKDSDDDDEE